MKTGVCFIIQFRVAPLLLAGVFAQSAALPQTLGSDSSNMQIRCQQAVELKKSADEYISQARQFHKEAQKQILEAQRLKGEARYLQGITNTTAKPVPLKLTPDQARAAVQQYKGDVQQFMQHAQAYEDHMQRFDQQVGQCHANEDHYQSSLKDYELHLQQFHLPNLAMPNVALKTGLIRPPHICKSMLLSQGEASSVAGQYLSDQARVLAAEQSLAKAESDLETAQKAAGVSNAKIETEIVRQQREQQLAMEYGKLKEEYDMLVIEKDRIAAINGKGAYPPAKNVSTKTATTTVQGKLAH